MKKGFTLIEVFVVVAILAILGTMVVGIAKNGPEFMSGDTQRQENALKALGLSKIRFTGSAWTECSEEDNAFLSKRFTATNMMEQPVSGAVCCGTFKGCTVRF